MVVAKHEFDNFKVELNRLLADIDARIVKLEAASAPKTTRKKPDAKEQEAK